MISKSKTKLFNKLLILSIKYKINDNFDNTIYILIKYIFLTQLLD